MKLRIRLWVKVLLTFIIILSLIFVYSKFLGIKGIKVNEYNIINSNIPSNFYGAKIIHMSDIHYKVTTNKSDLEKIVNEINMLKPDIVILSGDLFDSNVKYTESDFNDLKEVLSNINSSIGKFAISGEEDLNIDSWNQIIIDSGFSNLNDTYEFIYMNDINPILLVGISSNYENNHIKDDIERINGEINQEYSYSILVLHEPDFIDYIDYHNYNLILSGHSHGGQVNIPFINELLKDKYSDNYYKSYYSLGTSMLYISSGIGCENKYKFRFLNKPSINLYRLRNN